MKLKASTQIYMQLNPYNKGYKKVAVKLTQFLLVGD